MRVLALVLALSFLQTASASQSVELVGDRAVITGTRGPDVFMGWNHETPDKAFVFRVALNDRIYDLPRTLQALVVKLGDGDDVIGLYDAPASRIVLWLGAGNDGVQVYRSSLPSIDAGPGNDSIELEEVGSSNAAMLLGAGDDHLDVHVSDSFESRWLVDCGAGADTCRLIDIRASAGKFDGGDGSDRLIESSLDFLAAPSFVRFELFGP